MLIKDSASVQLVNLDRFVQHKNRQKIFCGEKDKHVFRKTFEIQLRPALFYSDHDRKFIEVDIRQIKRLNSGTKVEWHEIEIEIEATC